MIDHGKIIGRVGVARVVRYDVKRDVLEIRRDGTWQPAARLKLTEREDWDGIEARRQAQGV